MAPGDEMIGRRVENFGEIVKPGDYYGPTKPDADGITRVFFLKPNSRDDDAPESARHVHHCASPPHKFRECPDGSVEVRESIGDTQSRNPAAGSDGWHGYLDEGHRWRQV